MIKINIDKICGFSKSYLNLLPVLKEWKIEIKKTGKRGRKIKKYRGVGIKIIIDERRKSDYLRRYGFGRPCEYPFEDSGSMRLRAWARNLCL
jgi:hypothetical protein